MRQGSWKFLQVEHFHKFSETKFERESTLFHEFSRFSFYKLIIFNIYRYSPGIRYNDREKGIKAELGGPFHLTVKFFIRKEYYVQSWLKKK